MCAQLHPLLRLILSVNKRNANPHRSTYSHKHEGILKLKKDFYLRNYGVRTGYINYYINSCSWIDVFPFTIHNGLVQRWPRCRLLALTKIKDYVEVFY